MQLKTILGSIAGFGLLTVIALTVTAAPNDTTCVRALGAAVVMTQPQKTLTVAAIGITAPAMTPSKLDDIEIWQRIAGVDEEGTPGAVFGARAFEDLDDLTDDQFRDLALQGKMSESEAAAERKTHGPARLTAQAIDAWSALTQSLYSEDLGTSWYLHIWRSNLGDPTEISIAREAITTTDNAQFRIDYKASLIKDPRRLCWIVTDD